RRAMEFVPRHPHAIPPTTSPDRLSCGAAVRRSGPVSPPARVPARAGTPLGHRQTDPTPGRSPPAAWRGAASCRALPSPHQRWRTATWDNAGAYEPLPAGGTPLRMGLSTLCTQRLPVQPQGNLHGRLPERRAADGEGLGGRMLIEPIAPHRARLGYRDMEEPPLQKVRHGQRHPLERGRPRFDSLVPCAIGEGDAVAV